MPITLFRMRARVTMQPSEIAAWSMAAPLTFEGGRKRGRVNTGGSKKLNFGRSAAWSKLASKKLRIVPMSSQ